MGKTKELLGDITWYELDQMMENYFLEQEQAIYELKQQETCDTQNLPSTETN